jgi:predicted DNA-binding transcriptional regulator AlpA
MEGTAVVVPLVTRQVVRDVGISRFQLLRAIRDGRFAPPKKNASRAYVWGPADVARLRRLVQAKRKKTAS